MRTTLDDAAASYLKAKAVSRGTRNEYASTLRKWEQWGGDVPIEELRRKDVREFLGIAGIETVAITDRDAATALTAFARYGKGRRHPAQLNMGDCFAYAIAKNQGTELLFKGEDFGKTDIATAARPS